MPKLLRARPPLDAAEERRVRKLAGSRHAPGDWIRRARMIARSWDGLRTAAIAARAGLPSADGARAAAPLQRRGARRARRSARLRAQATADRGRARRDPRPGRDRPARPPGAAAARRARGRRRAGAGPLDPGRAGRGGPGARDRRPAQPGAADLPRRRRALARDALLDGQPRPGLRPKRAAVVALYTAPPAGATTVCVDELGPLIPRTYPPAPGWSRDGHRIKAPLDYGRGPEKVWVYGALRVRDGRAVTLTAASRNTAGYLRLLEAVARANPAGDLYLIGDNLSSHKSPPIMAWLAGPPARPPGLHPGRRLLAEPPGGLVAAVPPRGRRRPELRRRRRDRPRHPRRHRPAQPPRQTLGLEPPAEAASLSAPCLRLPPLRNGALEARPERGYRRGVPSE